MKKLVTLFLSFILVVCLAACGNSQSNEAEETNTSAPSAETSVEPESTQEPSNTASATDISESTNETTEPIRL